MPNDSIPIVHKPAILDNEYTRIIEDWCKQNGYNDVDTTYYIPYTEEDPLITVLSLFDDTCFAVETEIRCHDTRFSGSAGRDIIVFLKQNGLYNIVFDSFGFGVEGVIESRQHIRSFTYHTRYGYHYLVSFNGQDFEEETISINNLPYKPIKQIVDFYNKCEGYNYKYDEFIPLEPESEDNVHTRIETRPLQISKNDWAQLYVVHSGTPDYFILQNDAILFSTVACKWSEARSITLIPNAHDDYFDLSVFYSEDYVITKDTTYYVPTHYHYNPQTRQYEQSKKP